MNKKEIFIKAHKVTRETVAIYGCDYRTTFSSALKFLFEGEKKKALISKIPGVSIINVGSRIAVKSPYDKRFVVLARKMNGRWDSSNKAWNFDSEYLAEVTRAVAEEYAHLAQ